MSKTIASAAAATVVGAPLGAEVKRNSALGASVRGAVLGIKEAVGALLGARVGADDRVGTGDGALEKRNSDVGASVRGVRDDGASLAAVPFGLGNLFLITLVVGCLSSMSDASLVIGCFSCHRRLRQVVPSRSSLRSPPSPSGSEIFFYSHLSLGACLQCRMLLLPSEASSSGTFTELASPAAEPFRLGNLF